MGNHLKRYEYDTQYQTDLTQDKIVRPNVSLTVDVKKVYYNPRDLSFLLTEERETILLEEGDGKIRL